MMEATSYALDILYHIAPHIDITGIRRLKKPIVESWMSNPFDIKSVDRFALIILIQPSLSLM